jgi:hypothetical protein
MHKSHNMSHIKIPSAPVAVSKRSTGKSTWVIHPSEKGSDTLLRRTDLAYRSSPVAFDGREYLEAFMAVREPKDALAFVDRFGSPAAEINKWSRITFGEFQALQELVRTVANTPLSEWPPEELPIGLNPERLALRWDTIPFTFVHETDMGIEACCAQVFFEKLSGVEFRWCARPDCNQMFRKETGHDKLYCRPECAHLTAVRASRARLNKGTTRKKRSRKRL